MTVIATEVNSDVRGMAPNGNGLDSGKFLVPAIKCSGDISAAGIIYLISMQGLGGVTVNVNSPFYFNEQADFKNGVNFNYGPNKVVTLPTPDNGLVKVGPAETGVSRTIMADSQELIFLNGILISFAGAP